MTAWERAGGPSVRSSPLPSSVRCFSHTRTRAHAPVVSLASRFMSSPVLLASKKAMSWETSACVCVANHEHVLLHAPTRPHSDSIARAPPHLE